MAEAVDQTALLRLMTWLSPAFPVGAFAYSGGLEQALSAGLIEGPDGLESWIGQLIAQGNLWNDAVLLAESYRVVADDDTLSDVASLAEALSGSRERHQETMLLGGAFLRAASVWTGSALSVLEGTAAYPVAVGAVAGQMQAGIEATLAAFLHSVVSQLVSVAIRCSHFGQVEGVALLARIEPLVLETARRAADSSLDDLGSATLIADICSLKHETLGTRLFRS